MTLRNKLFTLVILPLILAVVMAAIVIWNKVQVKTQMDRLIPLSELVQKANDLVHELQKERGRTAGYIASNGSANNLSLLNKQRESTDNKLKVYKDFMLNFDLDSYDPSLKQVVSKAGSVLAKLESKREGITKQTIKLKEALSYYTNETNASLIETSNALIKISNSALITKMATGYYSFSLAKEKGGVERAVMNATFTKDKFAPGVYKRFVELVSAQDTNIANFLSFATPSQVSFYKKTINSGESKPNEGVNKFRAIANSKANTGSFGVDSKLWFSTITKKLGLLKIIESYVAKDIVETAVTLRDKASYWLWLSAIITLAAIAVIVYVALSMLKSIRKPITKIAEIARAVSVGDMSHKAEVGADDEIGKMAVAFNSMCDNIRVRVGLVEQIAEGDLTTSVPVLSDKDSLGIALSGMVSSLHSIVTEVLENAQNVSVASKEISMASQSLADGSTKSAASIEEISSSMTEVNGRTKSNAENAVQANQLTEATRKDAQVGSDQMTKMIASMDEINASSASIAKIIKVIDDIAFQTNLLALNAAVEAARAGKYGKGFAVVADEVRSLAGRSAKAANETSELIEQSNDNVKNGAEVAQNTAKSLEDIVNGVNKVSDLVAEISASSTEQEAGMNEMNEGIEQIDSVTQLNAANSEETASSAEILNSTSNELEGLLQRFKLGSTNKASTPVSSPAPVSTNRNKTHHPEHIPAKTSPAKAIVQQAAENDDCGYDEVEQAPELDSGKKDPASVIALDDDEFGRY